MKRTLAFLLALVLAVSALTACSININLGGDNPTEKAKTDTKNDNKSETTVEIPTIELPTEPEPIGALDDYVGVYKEMEVPFADGNVNVFSLPEIKLDSADAKVANAEIGNKYGEVFSYDNPATHGIVSLGYEAYLNDNVLSVVVLSKVDGGNTTGLAYNFDVITGEGLDNRELCEAVGEDYDAVMTKLKAAIEDAYEERFGNLPGNDEMREKTYSVANIESSVLYLDGSGDWMALALFYAAVGGGHFMTQLEL